jgi:lipid-binding SYLF domain-containing protein
MWRQAEHGFTTRHHQETPMLRKFLPTLAALGAVTAPALAAPPSPRETLTQSKQVLDDLTDKAKGIPAKLLEDAEAVVIVPNTIKAGLGIGGQIGHGVAIVKDKTGWGDIRFLDLGGASVGFQIGVQSTDVVLVFKNRKGLDRILDGKAKLKLGADASVAAGPLGRDAAIATDLKLKSEIYSYSRARGLFAGVSLDGVVLSAANKRTAEFEKDAGPETKKAADDLKLKIAELSVGVRKKDDPLPSPFAPAPIPGGAPRLIPVPMPMPPLPGGGNPPPPPVIDLPPPLETPAKSTVIPASATSVAKPDPKEATKMDRPAEPSVGPIRRLLRRLRGDE